MDIDCQFISIYSKFVTSLSAYYSCEDISWSEAFDIMSVYNSTRATAYLTIYALMRRPGVIISNLSIATLYIIAVNSIIICSFKTMV